MGDGKRMCRSTVTSFRIMLFRKRVAGFIVEKEYRDASFASVVSSRIFLGGTEIDWKNFLCLLC